MEPTTQVEIQLGHMCNNRCVFCVSGQETALGRARPLPVEPLLERLEEARARGHEKLTILGGEPTLQPAFPAVVRRAVELGFREIVVFTNGVKTARESFVDEVIALAGDRLTWRISIQGATREAHERTTRKPGSFGRIVETLEHLRRKGQRITVNLCVVRSNYASVPHFVELVARYGVRQLHLDMVRPLDAGVRTEEEFREMLPDYRELAPPLREMLRGFPPGFDANVGNLPYCFAPDLAAFIHHDGERTDTIAVDGDGTAGHALSRPWDKYFVKRRDKGKLPGCARCVFEPRCSGLFEKYREVHGTAGAEPVTLPALLELDPEGKLGWPHLVGLAQSVAALGGGLTVSQELLGDREARFTLARGAERVVLAVHCPAPAGVATHLRQGPFAVTVVEAPRQADFALEALRVVEQALTGLGLPAIQGAGADAVPGRLAPPVAVRVARLRAAAPFGSLRWDGLVATADGRRAELTLTGPDGEAAVLWLEAAGGSARGGYRLTGAASAALVEGLGVALRALRGGRRTEAPEADARST